MHAVGLKSGGFFGSFEFKCVSTLMVWFCGGIPPLTSSSFSSHSSKLSLVLACKSSLAYGGFTISMGGVHDPGFGVSPWGCFSNPDLSSFSGWLEFELV